ncbi:glycosyltransferase family 2 protein [Vagococcus fluvialis]|uniref:glycosyltransferase family 2 protein n=1 Tax=Vagococcus fluvialis TaxID=2738 RepID=UPI0014330F7B|nr:glycosyltransferase family 2 protein [Vagococcus fluvialis]NKC59712.1 glycosyltransferase family 2 protein [Vagococcus fluvialis]NKD50609.1 glycosyltransferase family 2 protein [Vagococcus fluvialis]
MKVLIIIPAYNEEGSILKTAQSIETYIPSVPFTLDYIIINDGSTDKTKEILIENELPSVHLIKNLGIGGAVQTGYIYAKQNNYDIAVQFDGDGQHDIKSIEDLVSPILKDEADFTIGSRFVEGSPSEFKTSASRRMGINLISLFIKFKTKKTILDVTSGYRAANKEVIDYFSKHYPKKYPEPETNAILIKQNRRVKEVGVNMFERLEGKSSITPIKSVRYMIEVLTSILIFSDRGNN